MLSVTSPSQPFRSLLHGGFADAALEDRFRREYLDRDLRVGVVAASVAVLLNVLFAISDYRLFGRDEPFFALLAGRVLTSLLSLAALAAICKWSTPRVLDRTLLAWSLMQVVFMLFVNFTRPNHYFGHNVYDVLAVVLAYVVLPIPTLLQMPGALLLSAGNLVLLLCIKQPPDVLTVPVIVGAYIIANLLGALVSWEVNRRRRLLYAALLQEQSLRHELEQALAEIRTLRGIVSICAHCKRIRDDDGHWHRLETFVQERTHAEFSHGICPNCSDRLLKEHFAERGE